MKLSMWDAMVALVAAPHRARSSMSQAEVAARRLSCAEKRCLGATVGGDKPPSPSFAGPADEDVGSGHYYKTGLCSWPFVPAAFGAGTIGGFCPGSNG